ncbi:hypothetical protein P7C71_g3633, partial [Lecanoromycetidae sp. Uapishka_2]
MTAAVTANPYDIQPMANDTVAGDFWTVKRQGEDWPVVICDEEMVEAFFMRTDRPPNARQADGNWGKGYGPGGDNKEKRCFPAIFLGTWMRVWAPCQKLEHFDYEIGQVIQDSATNPMLAQAWKVANKHYGDSDPLEYCKSQLRQKNPGSIESKATEIRSKAKANLKMPEKRKHKGMPAFKYPLGYTREEVDDEESSEFLKAGAEPKIKNEFSDSNSSADIDSMYDDHDPAIQECEGQSKRSKRDTIARFSTRPTTPLRQSDISRAGSASTSHKSRAGSKFPAKKKNIDPDRVIIYVGNPHTQFVAKRANLNISPLLKSLVAHHPDNGWYVMSPILSQLDRNDFLPIGQYLTRREYDPNILDEGTEFVRLEVVWSGPERGAEVIRCGMIYNNAQMLELPGLQDLAFRKLRALEKQGPHQAFAILAAVDMVFDKADEDLRQYLVKYIADHYWDLVLAETGKIAEIMNENEELTQRVFGLLSGANDVDTKTEEVAEVKKAKEVKTEKEEMKIFGNSAQSETAAGKEQETIIPSALGDGFELVNGEGNATIVSDGPSPENGEENAQQTASSSPSTLKMDEATEITDSANKGLDETEQEMIKMALRESDLEATEDDLEKLLARQSSFFEAYSPGARESTQT